MRHLVLPAALWIVACAGCEERPSAKSTDTTRPTPSEPTTAEPTATTSESASRTPEPTATTSADHVFGAWKGPRLCLELYPSGEFKLSDLGKGPKIVIMGEASQRRVDATHIELSLRPTRIRRNRWVSSCRKQVKSAKLLDTYQVLGDELSTTATTTLTLALLPDDAVELCARRCEILAAKAPELLGRWRSAKLEVSPQTAAGWKAGQPADLGVGDESTRISVGGDDGALLSVASYSEVRSVGPGRFELVITPHTIETSTGAEVTSAVLLGISLAVDAPATLTVERVKGGVQLCGSASQCETLPYFDDLM